MISGPYQLKQYYSEKIVIERRPDYWGNKAYARGQAAGAASTSCTRSTRATITSASRFSRARLDMSSTFVPRIWRKAEKGVRRWFDKAPYFSPTAMPMLLHQREARRRSRDVGVPARHGLLVNYTDIRELAMSGYSEPLQPGLILPFGLEAKYFSAEDAKQYGASYDPTRAKQILAEAGYKSIFNEKGDLVETRDKNGQRVPTVYIKSPTGWSDWESIVRIAVRGMREAGIDARERFVDASVFWNDIFEGEFDLIMNTPASPPSPSQALVALRSAA